VYFFALEAEPDELENRMLYSTISSRFYASPKRAHVVPGELSYDRWMRRLCKEHLGPLEAEAQVELAGKFHTLHVLYRHAGQFTVEDLEGHIRRIQSEADLIILDHIHYVDVEDNRDENAAYKKVIKTLNDCALTYGVPIIVIAHLRKTQQFSAGAVLPSIEDFHGTSDLAKVATKAILLGRGERSMDTPKTISPTLVKVAKNRRSGESMRYVAEVRFDLKTNSYMPGYTLGELTRSDKKWDPVTKEDDIPYWAERALRG
jgi:replicative DNA helicase